MRLTTFQIESIKESFINNFDKNDHLWLFGSRVDDTKKGGDIDLYIETSSLDLPSIAKKKITF